jgi:hypothetical protein
MLKYILVIAILLSSSIGISGDIYLENRVANRQYKGKGGQCWFACADSIAREKGIKNFIGVIDKLPEHHIGLYGASIFSMLYYEYILWVDVDYISHRDMKKLEKWINDDLLPIASIKTSETTAHAIILLEIREIRERKYIRYFDPNEITHDYYMPYWQFQELWWGTAQVIKK